MTYTSEGARTAAGRSLRIHYSRLRESYQKHDLQNLRSRIDRTK
jgi:hypothetical protein